MKILVVGEGYIPVPPIKYGGTERVIYYLIKGLVEAGHDVTLLASGDSQVPCKLIPICEKHTFFGKNDAEQAEVDKKIKKIRSYTKRLIKKLAPQMDIIHSHGFDLKDFQEYPNITTMHNMVSFYDSLDSKYFQKRPGLYYVTVSENQQHPNPDLQYVGVAYNGTDPNDFTFNPTPDNYLCFIGRFDEDKNPHIAIELALKLGMKIKLAGKLDYKGTRYFEEKIKPHLDNPLVEYWGEIGLKEKNELLSGAICNLHPTNFREPFGLTVLEAAYCGTPTLAIERGSMPELIEDGRTGILVEDFDEGYHVIQKCFEMDRNYISQRARLLFNYKTMTKQYEIAYTKVMEAYEHKKDFENRVRQNLLESQSSLQKIWRS